MKEKVISILLMIICALPLGAQIFTPEYEAYVDTADQYIKKEKWDAAETYIRKALRTEPANKSNYLLWANLGMICANQNKHIDAVEAYSIGLNTAPKSTTLLTNRAASYLALGDNRGAIKDLNLALSADSTLTKARKLRGYALYASGQMEEALSDFDIYEEKNGQESSIQSTRGDILINLEESEKALKCYKKAYNLEPDETVLVKYLTASFLVGKLDEENELLSKGLKDYPRNGNLYLLRAALNRQRFQTSAMESDLKIARSLGADESLRNLIVDKKSR